MARQQSGQSSVIGPLPSRELLRARNVAALLGISVVTLWRWTRTVPKFPKPIRIGEASVCWLKSELDSWLADKRRERDNDPVPPMNPRRQNLMAGIAKEQHAKRRAKATA